MDEQHVKQFDSLEDMFAYMEDNERQANEQTHPSQRSIGRGEYVIRPMAQFLIFGYLYEEGERDATRPDLFERGYRTGMWYSDACPEGEPGDAHVVTLWRIMKEEFDAAKELEWETEQIIRTDWGRKMFARIQSEQENTRGSVHEDPGFVVAEGDKGS